MGEKDLAQKTLEDYNDVFADIVNGCLFGGKEIIHEDDLEQETQESVYKADERLREQRRDVAKLWKHNQIRLALIGLENQLEIDKYMPIRIMSYDAACYRDQLNKQMILDETTGKLVLRKNPTPIYPVFTLVLYFGNIPWKQYKTLLETISTVPELKPYLNDYKINVVEVAFLTQEKINRFKSDFKIVADYFVQSRINKDYIPAPQTIKHVNEVLRLLAIFAGDNRFEEIINLIPKGELTTMSNILDKIEARGEARGKFDFAYKLIKQGLLTMEQAATSIGISTQELLAQFKQYNLVL